jgi:cell division protein FtsB
MIPKFKKFKKGFSQTVFFSTLLGVLVLGVIGFLVVSNFKISQRRATLTARIEALKKEIQILEEKNAALKAGISQTEGEDYWKGELYEQGYVEKGEQQVVILPPEEAKKEEKSPWNPQNWWEWIKSKIRQ